MLRTLHVENIAVIKCLDLSLEDGLTVLTGETGAGKSILIDSVNLLLGGKFSREIIRSGEKRAVVSALFDSLSEDCIQALTQAGYAPDDDGCVIVQRILNDDGKNTMRLCGLPVTAAMLRDLGRYLLNIHGQNDNQRLLQRSSHLQILDAMGDFDEQYNDYRTSYQAWRSCVSEMESLGQSEAEQIRLREMLEYQIRDIDALKLKKGELDALTRERARLQNIEKIQKYAGFTCAALDGKEKGASVSYLLGRSAAALRQISQVIPQADACAEQLEDLVYRVRDVADQVSAWLEDDVSDPTARLDAVEARLDGIARLQKKYGQTEEDILAFRERASEQLQGLQGAQERLEALEARCKTLLTDCKQKAAVLTECRCRVAEVMTERVQDELSFLDMPKVRFHVAIRPSEQLLATGGDDVEFLIATNPGEPLMPMIKIASGGELSRLMLALKSVLNDRDGVGTVVFDEVDTGISGKTSRKVGIRLRQMGRRVQVICITHAAQIASLADTHVLISKDQSNMSAQTHLEVLDDQGRVEEIARILGGLQVTEAQRKAAQDMIAEREGI